MPAKNQEILNQKINDLPFTAEFKFFSQKNGFITIGEIAGIPIVELMELDKFTYHILQELVHFFEQRDMASLLKQ